MADEAVAATEGPGATEPAEPAASFLDVLATEVRVAVYQALGRSADETERNLSALAGEVSYLHERQDDLIRQIRRLEIVVGELTKRLHHADAA